MANRLTPLLLKDAVNADVVQKAMTADLKNFAGKSGVKFVAAKNYVIKGKTINLLIVSDNILPYEAIIKTQAKALRAKGTCDVAKDATTGKTKVTIKSSSGQMLADGIAKLLPLVTNHDANVEADHFVPGAAPAAKSSDELQKAKDARKDNADKALEMAKRSHEEARLPTKNLMKGEKPGPKLDWPEFKPDDASIARLGRLADEWEEYQTFAEAYEKLAVEYDFKKDPDYKKVPVNVWHALIKGMTESGYITANIPKVDGDPWKLIFANRAPNGGMIREELLKRAMLGMQVYIRHAGANLDKVAKAVEANGGKTWSFWSGEGAKNAALAEAGDGVVLEGSIGSWYDKIWKFEHLTGVNDMLLWNSMSELYARKAAEYYQKFKFIGFIGPGGGADTTVFVNIERPTLIQVLNVEKRVPVPDIDWRVVVCRKKESERSGYEGTGAPSISVPSRMEAVAEVKRRYPAKGTSEYNALK